MKIFRLFAFIMLVASLLSPHAIAQNIQRRLKFRRIEANPQLSNQNITAIEQDQQGYLWVGTNDGLNRFDGYDFKVYRNIRNDSASLAKNVIQSIFEDSNGVLWVSTMNMGLHYYDREADVFRRVPEFTQLHCQVLKITEDSDHHVWISGVINSQAFVATQDQQTKTWKQFLLFPTNDGIYTMLHYSGDEFWLGTRVNGLYRWNRKTNELTQFQHTTDPNSIAGNYIQELVKDAQGDLWIANRGAGVSKYDYDKKSFSNFSANTPGRTSIINNEVLDICIDAHCLWVSTENGGISKMNMSTGEVVNFYYDKNDEHSIINSTNWTLYKDRQGRVWIGSYAKGLCVMDPLEEKISVVDISMQNDLVNAIIKDSRGRLWIGTVDGLLLLEGNKRFHFKHSRNDPNSISSNPVLCIYEDRRHRIWIGNWNGGLNLFNENSKNFRRFKPSTNQKGVDNGGSVFAIGESSVTGQLLVGTFNGLQILKDEKSGIFEGGFQYPHEGDQLLMTMLEDSNHNLWVGSYGGLQQYSLTEKRFMHIPLISDSTEGSDRVNSIFEDSKKRLWVGSDGGLYEVKDQKSIHAYTVKDGLPVNVVMGISEDSRGHLWLGTTKGLTVFDVDKRTFKTYDESDGLLSAELRVKSFFEADDGQFFVGGKGVNTFYPDSLVSNPHEPPVYITDLKIFNQSIRQHDKSGILQQDISETKEIYLDYTHAFITIDYVGINFTNSYKNQYAYKLDGFDPDWNYVGDQRFAAFTNLNPGTYTFRVKAANNDGLWNEEGASLIIHILPPWWETLLFRIFLVVLVIGIVILIFKLRTRSILRTNIELERAVSEKTEEIKAQNEVLTVQREVMARQNENLEAEVVKRTKELVEYNHQLEQFAFISAHNLRAPVARILGLGQLLAMAEKNPEEKEQIYPRLIRTAEELDGVVRDLSTILELKKNSDSFITDIDLTVSVQLICDNLEKEIRQSNALVTVDFSAVNIIRTVKPYFESVFYNLISNAIKYRHPDRQPSIDIRSELHENEICLIVKDNGLGIDLKAYREKLFTLYSRFHDHVEGKGMGLYLVKTQMESMGGRIEIESELYYGTTFRAFFRK